MSDAFLGEIRQFAGSYAPKNWAFCNGGLMSIAEHTALFSLLGTTYGGDGRVTFGLPDLRGRLPMHEGEYFLGQWGGYEEVRLAIQSLATHSHPSGSGDGPSSGDPEGKVFAATGDKHIYGSGAPEEMHALLAPEASVPVGGGKPHTNLMPFLCVNFIICLDGLYPPRS